MHFPAHERCIHFLTIFLQRCLGKRVGSHHLRQQHSLLLGTVMLRTVLSNLVVV